MPNAARRMKEDSMLKLESNAPRFVDLQAPEVLEFKTAPMWMCCGSWSYTISLNAVSLFTVSLTWSEDSDAACSGILF
jgi:hypothetical protein